MDDVGRDMEEVFDMGSEGLCSSPRRFLTCWLRMYWLGGIPLLLPGYRTTQVVVIGLFQIVNIDWGSLHCFLSSTVLIRTP